MRALRVLSILCFLVLFPSAVQAQVRIDPLLPLEGETSAPALSPDGKTLVFNWCKPDYQGCGIYSRPLAGGEARLLVGGESPKKTLEDGSPTDPHWSPDGKLIYYTRVIANRETRISVYDVETGVDRRLGSSCGYESRLSPDGRFLFANGYAESHPESLDCRPTLLSASTGKRLLVLARRGEVPTPSPDGRMAAFGSGNALMLLRLTESSRPAGPAVAIAQEPRSIVGAHWSPDGKQLIYEAFGDVPYLRRLSLGPGSRPQPISGLTGAISISQVLPDGSALATERVPMDAVWRTDLQQTPVQPAVISDSSCFAGAPGCSPDGSRKVTISTSTGLSQILVADANGGNERLLVKSIPGFVHPSADGALSWVGWSPDGKWIAFTVFATGGNADIRVHLYVLPSSGGIPRRLGKEAFALYQPVWSPDSKSLYALQDYSFEDESHGSQSRIVRIDVADGRLTEIAPKGHHPQLSPDGTYLYYANKFDSELYRLRLEGGAPERIWKSRFRLHAYAAGSRHLYLDVSASNAKGLATQILRLDPQSNATETLAELPFRAKDATLSPDQRYLYLHQADVPTRRVVLVHGLFN